MSNPNGIRVDDGTREYTITNHFGRTVAVVHFKPQDVSLISRYEQAVSDLPRVMERLTKGGDNLTTQQKWERLQLIEAELKAMLNTLLDSNDADAVFAHTSPLSIIGGVPFFKIVMDALGGIISEACDQAALEANARMEKHLNDLEQEG